MDAAGCARHGGNVDVVLLNAVVQEDPCRHDDPPACLHERLHDHHLCATRMEHEFTRVVPRDCMGESLC